MLRNVLRTSRWLARRPINTLVPVVSRQFSDALSAQRTSTEGFIYRRYSAINQAPHVVDPVVFEQICSETLESLSDYFEELIEDSPQLKGADVTYSDGVLTVDLGKSYGTYVINRQSPNKQIWLSSPLSGPKRYDLVLKDGGCWTYKHDGVTLHKLLQEEISKITNKADFSHCSYSIL